jgi:hypothetical protein
MWRSGTAVAVWLLAASAVHAAPVISNVGVSDVTPFGFSVVWEASEPSNPGIQVFSDAAGTVEVTSQFEITPFPLRGGDPTATDVLARDAALAALRDASRVLGLMRIAVHGGAPSTAYYFRVSSEASGQTTFEPVGSPTPVTTAAANSFVAGSHQLLVSFGAPNPEGWIVTAETAETVHAVSAIVGDGAASNEAYLNLGQLFDLGGSNWQPDGSKPVTISVRQGAGGGAAPSFDLLFSPDFMVGLAYLVDFDSAFGMLIALVDPGVDQYTTGETILVSWTDEFPDPDGLIDLYYDTDDTGEDGSLIVSGLAEVPDGPSDTYDWDTTAVADGKYFVYASVSNATTSEVSYSVGQVTIDRGGSDSDADQMSDLWEEFYFGNLGQTGAEDGDSDGSSEAEEFSDLTDPGVPDVRLSLVEGLNLVSFPVSPTSSPDSGQLLQLFGGVAAAINRVDPATGLVEETELVGGVPQGDIFPIAANEGYYLRLLADFDDIFDGLGALGSSDFVPGVNLAGFPSIPAGYDALQLLTAIGGSSVVSSISRFDPETGRAETVAYVDGVASGVNFPIQRGVAYLISMEAAVVGFTP